MHCIFQAFLTRLRSAVDRHPSSQQSEALSTNTPSIEHQPRENLNMRAADDHAAPEGPLVVPPGLDADVPSWAEERMRRINHARVSFANFASDESNINAKPYSNSKVSRK